MSALQRVRLHPLQVHADARGYLFEMIRPPRQVAQANLVAAAPGSARGGHSHTRKTEWFCAVQGEARFHLRDVADGSAQEVLLRGPTLLEIPPGVWHGLTNPGPGELLLVAFMDEPFDPADADTYP